MSLDATRWVFDHSPYKMGARLVHLALADVANEENDWHVWMSLTQVAKRAGVGRATLYRAIEDMERDRFLAKIEVPGKRSGYRFLMPESVSQRDIPAETSVSQRDKSVAQRDTSGEGKSVSQRDKSVSQRDKPEAPTVSSITEELNMAFEAFWNDYPKRNGQRIGKAEALTVWKYLSKVDRKAAHEMLPAYADSAGDFPKDPARYLRKRLWQDLELSLGRSANPAAPATAAELMTDVRIDRAWVSVNKAIAAGKRGPFNDLLILPAIEDVGGWEAFLAVDDENKRYLRLAEALESVAGSTDCRGQYA